MNQPRIVIFRSVDESGESHRLLRAAGCELIVDANSAAELLEHAAGAHALLGATYRFGVIDRQTLAASAALRIVSKYTIGVEDVDIDAATELGILVTHCPTEANWGGVAEGTLALILTLLKKTRERDRVVKRGHWRSTALEGRYIGAREDGYAGLTIGIVGLGRIGRRVAELLAPWRAQLLATDPYVEAQVFSRHGAEQVELAELLERADVVTLHCSLTDETRGLMNAAALGRMQDTAVLINTARGAVVDIEALADALDAGLLAGAALDVLPTEPPAADARIVMLGDRILLSPHMVAANQGGTLRAAIPWATDATLAALRGELPEHIYNVEAIPRWQERFAGDALL